MAAAAQRDPRPPLALAAAGFLARDRRGRNKRSAEQAKQVVGGRGVRVWREQRSRFPLLSPVSSVSAS